MKVEYRIKPVTRYVITKYHEAGNGLGSVSTIGEYNNPDVAYEVGYALCKAEHDQLGYEPGDMRVIYPQHPNANAQEVTQV
jgi:hypothetical protein